MAPQQVGPGPQTRVTVTLGVVFTVLLGGCLFPPVESPPDDDREGPGSGTPGPSGTPPPGAHLVRRSASYQDAGEIAQAASAGGTATATERHTHELPPRLVGLTLRFDWEPQAAEDLDVTLSIQRGGKAVWTHRADGGRTGAPDNPIDRVFDDLGDDVYTTAPSLLVIDVTAEATYSTLYDYAGTYTYDAPEPAASSTGTRP